MARLKEGVQWTQAGGVFVPVGKTVRHIPPAIYRLHFNGETWGLKPVEIVTDDLIQVPAPASDRVRERIHRFQSARQRYLDYGLVHKTGVLIYGSPGCGKTILLQSLASEFAFRGGIVIQGDSPERTGHMLRVVRDIEPDRLIVVMIEDIESVIEHDEEGLLSLLDGESQVNGVAFIATTNKLSELPPRIINRPSRFDERIEIGMPPLEARRAYLQAKMPSPESGANEVEWLARATDGFSFAHLKECVVAIGCLEQDSVEVVRRLRAMQGDAEGIPMSAGGEAAADVMVALPGR